MFRVQFPRFKTVFANRRRKLLGYIVASFQIQYIYRERENGSILEERRRGRIKSPQRQRPLNGVVDFFVFERDACRLVKIFQVEDTFSVWTPFLSMTKSQGQTPFLRG